MTIQLLLMVTLAKSRRYLRCTQLLVAIDIRRLLSSMTELKLAAASVIPLCGERAAA